MSISLTTSPLSKRGLSQQALRVLGITMLAWDIRMPVANKARHVRPAPRVRPRRAQQRGRINELAAMSAGLQ